MQKIILCPDEFLEPIDWAGGGERLILYGKPQRGDCLISPNADEHYLNTNLLEFVHLCHRNRRRVVAYGRPNHLPFYSMFADEIILSDARDPTWYDDEPLSENKIDIAKAAGEKRYYYLDLNEVSIIEELSSVRRLPTVREIVDAFAERPIYIKESAYRVFQDVSRSYPRDLVVCEIKQPGKWMKEIPESWEHIGKLPNLVGQDYKFQKKLLQTVGPENYLSFQLLASFFLGWVFLCVGGSANLFSVAPARSLLLADDFIWRKHYFVIRAMMAKRYRVYGETGLHVPVIVRSKDDYYLSKSLMYTDFLLEGLQFLRSLPAPEIVRMDKRKYLLL